jgi:hypothetical protein
MWPFRIFSSVLFLTVIILAIPLAFDVGGRTCGLAFSLSLATFYFLFSTLRVTTPDRSRFRYALIQIIRATQWLIMPGMLIWSLNKFSIDSDNSSGWVERTFSGKRAQDTSVKEWIFGADGLVEAATIGSWDKLLRWSTPAFQLCEGFCTLLIIQSAGRLTRWVVNRGEKSDSWMVRSPQPWYRKVAKSSQIGLLVASATIISGAVYFLWRVMQFPSISTVDGTLIGVVVTTAVFLCAWGIGSGRGNPVESSLLFAYVVLCIYQIFTDYQPSNPQYVPPPSQAADFPPFPPIIMASYSTLMHALSTLPSTIHASFNFLTAAFSTLTPSVLVSLAYRIFVLYAATRIIPSIREGGPSALSSNPSLEDTDGAGQVLGFISWFSPSILIAVYTSLLMQHFASTEAINGDWWSNQGAFGNGASNLWRWINVAFTLGLYALELWLGGEEDIDAGMGSHWKSE